MVAYPRTSHLNEKRVGGRAQLLNRAAAAKALLGSPRVPRLSSTEMDTEVHGGVPQGGGRHTEGRRQERKPVKVVFLLETSIKLQKKVVVLPRREHREVSHARIESLLFFKIALTTV